MLELKGKPAQASYVVDLEVPEVSLLLFMSPL